MSALPVTLRPTLLGRGFVLTVAVGYPTLVWLGVRYGAVDGIPSIGLAFLGYFALTLFVPLAKLLRKVFGQRLVIHADGVELCGPGRARVRVRWGDLRGYRISGVSLVLAPRDERSLSLEVESHFDLPCVKRHLPAELQELPEEKPSPVSVSRVHRWFARLPEVALVLLYVFGRGPAVSLVIAALLPLAIALAALLRVANPLVLVSDDGSGPFPRLVFFAGLPAAAWAIFRASPVNELAPWALAAAGAAALALLVRKVQPGAWSPLRAALYLPGLGAWSVGVLLAANALLDTSPPELHQVAVVERVERSWKDPVLVLAPWGPITEPTRLRVRPKLHEAAAVGGTVDVTLHRGALGIPWYRVERVSGP